MAKLWRIRTAVFLSLGICFTGFVMANVPFDFVSLQEVCSDIVIEASYSSTNNFTGSIVNGYKSKKAYLAKAPADALCDVQKMANKQGLGLKIYDGYRPVKAVKFFQEWARKPESNPEIKEIYYPRFTRIELFENGYISRQSSHSRGSAVDLTLVNLESGKELDMGSGFDFFDDLSHTTSSRISKEQRQNRLLLKSLMESHGFKNFSQEWWHYSYRPEPYPDRYFDFDVE